MSKSNLIIGRDLGLAICKHFGIDTAKHVVGSDFEIKTEPGKPVTVKLTLMLTADDLAGIARAAEVREVEGGTACSHAAAAESVRAKAETFRDAIRAACDLPAMGATSQRTSETGELRVSIDPDASELLRRYGLGRGGAVDEIRLLREEVKQMRESMELTQYAIAKNAKRVARHLERWDLSGLPEHSKNQPMPEDSVQRGPKSGHFIDDHGIRHKNLGGQG